MHAYIQIQKVNRDQLVVSRVKRRAEHTQGRGAD